MALFSGQLWAVVHGQPIARSRAEFADHGAALWGYAAPTYLHALTRLIGRDLYAEAGYTGIRVGLVHDNGSYLGIVTLALLINAAARRVRFRRAAFWWAALALLVILSMGAHATIAGRRVDLPSLWLYRNTFAFRLIRSPARFNLFAAVFAALIAGAGLANLLARVRRPSARGAILAALATLAVADLGMTPLFGASRTSRLAAYNPDPARPVTLHVAAAAPRTARTVVLRHGRRELARWRVEPGAPRLYATPPLHLPRGRVDLVLEADGEDRPRSSREALDGARSPFSLRVTGVSLRGADARARGGESARR